MYVYMYVCMYVCMYENSKELVKAPSGIDSKEEKKSKELVNMYLYAENYIYSREMKS